jgi:hypothetical protein
MPPTTFTPSPEQQKVIDHRGGHLQVVACAEAGKPNPPQNYLIDVDLPIRMELLQPILFLETPRYLLCHFWQNL